MIIYDLSCDNAHRFEGWFASAQDFESQSARGLTQCPACGSSNVARLPAGLRSTGRDGDGPAAESGVLARRHAALRVRRWLHDNFENVGERFAEEARSMHYGEKQQRAIRGAAAPQTVVELCDEGIEVLALPVLAGPNDNLN